MNIETTFDLASLTKIYTTTVILQLVTQKRITLSTRLGDCLPEVSMDNRLNKVTIKELLTHSSGLIAWFPFYSQSVDDNFFNILSRTEVRHRTNKRVVYSDLNFILLGEVIKSRLGLDLQTAIQQYISLPLGLSTLSYGPVEGTNIAATEFGNRIEKGMCKKRNIHFENWRKETEPITGEVNDGNSHYYFQGCAGHAGLFANVKDLVKVGELYLNGGCHNGNQLLKEELVKDSLREHLQSRGLGWETSELYPAGSGHTGFTGTALWVEPENRIAVGLLTNRLHVNSPKDISTFRAQVFKEVYKQVSN